MVRRAKVLDDLEFISQHTQLPVVAKRLVSGTYICERLGISRQTLDRWIKAGKFPGADLVLGGKTLRWADSTVNNWVNNRV